jgi:DNA polymerase III subunit beta
MNVKFDRETLLGKIRMLVPIIPKKPVLSAHEQFLFEIKGGVANITATDGQKQITVWCDTAKCDGDATFTVHGRLLFSTLGLLLEPEVKLSVKDGKVELKCGKSKYKMASESGEHYPVIESLKSEFEASFSGAIFNESMETAKRYTNPENSVVAQQGVCLRFMEGKMNMYGYCGNEVCKVVVNPRSVNKWDDIIIPSSAVKAMVECVSDSDIVDISHDTKKMEVRTENVAIIALALEAKYPDAETFYRKKPETHVKHNTVQFLRSIERLKPYAKEESMSMVVDIKTSSTTLTVDNIDFSRDGLEELDAVAEKELRFGLNLEFMLKALKSFTNDEFNMFYSDPEKLIYIEPVSILKDNDKFIVMSPQLLNS